MLSYAFQELRQNNYVEIGQEEFENIHDLYAEILAKGIAYPLKQGLHKEYITYHESLTAAKGKLDINGTIRNKMKRNRQLSCYYDELSENCLFNQVIKTTLVALIKTRNVKKERKSKLKQLLLFFDNVDVIEAKNIKWTLFRFDRNTRTYRMLLYICYFVMQSLLLTTDEGTIKMKEFTDEHINRLYEKFILEYYRRHYPELRPTASQINWNVNKEMSNINVLPIMQTDVVLHFHNRRLIIDAKYYGKTMQTNHDKKTIHSSNLYQIQSYVLNLDADHQGNVDGMLLYARTQEEVIPHDKVVTKDGNVLYFRTLNLNQAFRNIEKQLRDIIKHYM